MTSKASLALRSLRRACAARCVDARTRAIHADNRHSSPPSASANASAGWTGASLLHDTLRLLTQDPAPLTLSLPIATAVMHCLAHMHLDLCISQMPLDMRSCVRARPLASNQIRAQRSVVTRTHTNTQLFIFVQNKMTHGLRSSEQVQLYSVYSQPLGWVFA